MEDRSREVGVADADPEAMDRNGLQSDFIVAQKSGGVDVSWSSDSKTKSSALISIPGQGRMRLRLLRPDITVSGSSCRITGAGRKVSCSHTAGQAPALGMTGKIAVAKPQARPKRPSMRGSHPEQRSELPGLADPSHGGLILRMLRTTRSM